MSFFSGRRVLVTGCTGLVGWWLAEALARRGAEVAGLSRDPSGTCPPHFAGLGERIRWFQGSVENAGQVEAALLGHQVDTVFHLAAQSLLGPAQQSPAETYETNIKGTWTVLDACRRSPLVVRAVVASSSHVYGYQEPLPLTEERPLLGAEPYALSKICAEAVARGFHDGAGLAVGITRGVNVFGAGDLHPSRLVPGTIRLLLAGERPVIRSDGTPVREYIHAADMAAGLLALATRLGDPEHPQVQGQAFNFGTYEPGGERPLSVLELTRLLARLCRRPDLEPVVLGEVRGEVRHHYLSSERARRSLGWQPGANLEERLLQTVHWYAEQAGVSLPAPC